MSKNIGSIVWPVEPAVAIRVYLRFLLKVIEEQNVEFPDSLSNPVTLVNRFLNDEISEVELNSEANAWWGILDSRELLRDFENKEALLARLALCLLCVKEQFAPQLGEHLSWFIEVMGFLELDVGRVVVIMEEYFEFA